MERVHYKVLLALFLLYGFALTPLGLYKEPVEEVHPGYYSAGKFDPARKFYALAVAKNPRSYAALQLERANFLAGRIDLDPASLLNELKSGKSGDEINRRLGIYYLDALKQLVEAMKYFKSSLETNPEQAHKKGMESALSQYGKQWRRLTSRGQDPDSLPGLYFHMLNTEINRVRLNFFRSTSRFSFLHQKQMRSQKSIQWQIFQASDS